MSASIEVTHALTLHRPWSWAITHGGKRVENRSWKPYGWLIGKHLAIHAGKHFDEAGAATIRPWFPGLEISDESIPHSQIVCVAEVLGWVHEQGHSPSIPHTRTGPLLCSRWFSGPIGWVLGEPLVFPEPVPTRGFQGVWAIPPALVEKVDAQVAAAQLIKEEESDPEKINSDIALACKPSQGSALY